jgi:hypothetical protein
MQYIFLCHHHFLTFCDQYYASGLKIDDILLETNSRGIAGNIVRSLFAKLYDI